MLVFKLVLSLWLGEVGKIKLELASYKARGKAWLDKALLLEPELDLFEARIKACLLGFGYGLRS